MTGGQVKVVIVPCSGIGKPTGSVSREAAYELCDELRPTTTDLVALSKLVLGEKDAKERVCAAPAITIDGCKLMCAAKLVKLSGGKVAREVGVLDVYREHKDLKPEGIAELNQQGKQLAQLIAKEAAVIVDELVTIAPTAPAGGHHD